MAAIEPINKALTIAGIPLAFDSFDLMCFPGFNTSVLYKGEVSLYEVEKQNFVFQVSLEECLDKRIIIDTEFSMEDHGYKYTFKLDRPPIHDLTGWASLHCNLISVKIAC